MIGIERKGGVEARHCFFAAHQIQQRDAAAVMGLREIWAQCHGFLVASQSFLEARKASQCGAAIEMGFRRCRIDREGPVQFALGRLEIAAPIKHHPQKMARIEMIRRARKDGTADVFGLRKPPPAVEFGSILHLRGGHCRPHCVRCHDVTHLIFLILSLPKGASNPHPESVDG
ncbi:MAG TPA: hypothetical protein VGM72_13480 [Micropepsaceae bacterium]